MASLKSFDASAKAEQRDITTSGKLGETRLSAKGTLNGTLKDDITAKLIITDETLSSVRRARAHRRRRGAARAPGAAA